MSSLSGGFKDCGPGKLPQIDFTCTGPSCKSLGQFPGGGITNGINYRSDARCDSETSNYVSQFHFSQPQHAGKHLVAQTQNITLPDCKEVHVQCDGTSTGIKVDGLKRTSAPECDGHPSSPSGVPYVDVPPVSYVDRPPASYVNGPPASYVAVPPTPSSIVVPAVDLSSLAPPPQYPTKHESVASTIPSQGPSPEEGESTGQPSTPTDTPATTSFEPSTPTEGPDTPPSDAPSSAEPEAPQFTGSATYRGPPKMGIMLLLVFFFGLFIQGTSAFEVNRETERRIEKGAAYKRDVKTLSENLRVFASQLEGYFAIKINPKSGDGTAFAEELISDTISSICQSHFSGATTDEFSPVVLERCLAAVYDDCSASDSESEFIAVFGASMFCNYLISQAYPIATYFDGSACGELKGRPQGYPTSSPLVVSSKTPAPVGYPTVPGAHSDSPCPDSSYDQYSSYSPSPNVSSSEQSYSYPPPSYSPSETPYSPSETPLSETPPSETPPSETQPSETSPSETPSPTPTGPACPGLLCSGVCKDLATDPVNCGECDNVCESGVCTNSVCAPPCTGELCSGVCKDLTSDPANCGGCGTVCVSGLCVDSVCIPPCNGDLCGGICKDVTSDPENCGGCGTVCESGICADGICIPPCEGELCNGVCKDITSDPDNCGGCGTVCESGLCTDSVCTPPCNGELCGGICKDVTSDPKNCGACGTVCESGSCSDSVCTPICDGAFCGGTCKDLRSDPNNCGGCGNVCDSGVCGNGACSLNSCTGQTCDTFTACGPGGFCICASIAGGTGLCSDGGTSCSGLADCSTSNDCPLGSVCAVGTCCSRNVCLVSNTCGGFTNEPRDLLRRALGIEGDMVGRRGGFL